MADAVQDSPYSSGGCPNREPVDSPNVTFEECPYGALDSQGTDVFGEGACTRETCLACGGCPRMIFRCRHTGLVGTSAYLDAFCDACNADALPSHHRPSVRKVLTPRL